jgi:hypothetical protein
MASDSIYLIGFFSYFGLESQKPDMELLFTALRSLQTGDAPVDISHFEDDARHLVDGMDSGVVDTIQRFLEDGHSQTHFMNGWRVAEILNASWGGGSKTLH